MTVEHRDYTSAERADYDPGPCPYCGKRTVFVHWIQSRSLVESNPDKWQPNPKGCLDDACPSHHGGEPA